MGTIRIEKAITRYECNAPDIVFGDWDKADKEVQKKIRDNYGLPCDGGGNPGEWCVECVFDHEQEVLEFDEDYSYD